jgi:uncharacterized repeat protein (TIGR01451 family)
MRRGRAAAWLLAWALGAGTAIPGVANATDIVNTASVSYRLDGHHGTETLQSNTVKTPVLPLPTPAELSFLRYDPDSPDSTPVPIDGGQCRTDTGSFAPLPPVVDADGKPVDSDDPPSDEAPGYYTGEPIVVSVKDANRNADPKVREYVDVDLTTTTGDAETLRLQETGPDTGVFAGAIQSVPMPPAATQYDCVLSLAAFAQITARYTDTDFPLDALAVAAAGYAPLDQRTVIRLDQTVSKEIVEIGDFLQYTLVVTNSHDAPAINVRVNDLLPPGLRYRAGSLRVGGAAGSGGPIVAPQSVGASAGLAATKTGAAAATVDPVIEDGGRTLKFPAGSLEPGASVTATFVAEVGAGASGQTLLNYAIAHANGSLSSNETDTVVRMRESLDVTKFTIVGRVTAGQCGDDPKATGVAGVRVLLDDGTYATTDANGAYHFEGMRPGTHVVQLDRPTVPAELEPAQCFQNTRFAGRADSQFVEAQGGMLWRADFRLRPKPPVVSEVGTRLGASADGGYWFELDGGAAPVAKLRAIAMLPAGVAYLPGSATVDGKAIADPEVSGNAIVFDLGDPGGGWRRRIGFRLRTDACPPPDSPLKGIAVFQADGKSGQRTPPATLPMPCGPPGAERAGERTAITVAVAPQGATASPFAEQTKIRAAILSDIEAGGGGDVDWFKGQAPGRDWVFPVPDYNPRAPSTRVALKYQPADKVTLRINGQVVSPLHFDGSNKNATGTIAIGTWRGIDLVEGDNLLQAEIADASGAVVARLERTVHYANGAARAELVPGQSILVADGLHNPVVAVRMLDRAGKPVRAGVTGEYSITAPYTPAYVSGEQQSRQFAGLERATPTWHIEGDDGIAYIELAPTGVAGSFTLGFGFGASADDAGKSVQQIQGWLKSSPRDWVVVGFAKGSVGYDTLADNMQALPEGEDGSGVRADGQVSLYAKGRVLGKWLMTLAYDSGKPTDRLRDQSLLSTIDPGQYYTLYGDDTRQGYDAASARKLYLKLERDQFYALFGDFQTGLDRNELSRYQRALNGMKVEYHGDLVEFNGFAAKTAQGYARDEIQGDGTSGLYHLRRGPIVLNSERIRIETRDRYHSEQIIASRELVRHIDYDIDYDAGTLFFREPVASRDFDFNPNWIVAEYETAGTGEEYLNAGGRVGVHALGGRLEAGATYVRDQDSQSSSRLAGVDAKFRVSATDEVRAEAAATRGEGDAGSGASRGNAWLVEWEHRGEQLNFLAYARRQGPGFGLGQQNGYESGMFKTGVQGQYRLGANFSLQGEVYRQEDVGSGAVRDAANAEIGYRIANWNLRAGLQWAHDRGADGTEAESRQVTLGASRSFMDGRLDLGVQGAFSLGGKNESVDFPTRLQFTASYKVNDAFRILASQEFTDGADRDTSTTRFGFEATPWANAKLSTTLNQSQISEYGPRTFALFGLDQRIPVGEHWTFDAALDSSQAFNDTGATPLVVDPSQPVQAGGIRDGGALTENFVALSGGAAYQAELWSWNARLEGRKADTTDRYGVTSAFLRQPRDGVALAASLQAFSQRNADGSTGLLADAQLSWAWRPLDSDWSILDKLEFRYDGREGAGVADPGLGSGDVRSARIINNFVMNLSSDAWRAGDGEGDGNVLDLNQRSQLSLYYGSKYVLDSFDGDDYAGYTDIMGGEWRFDLSRRIDIGLRASVIHSWSQKTFAWAFGPSVGFSPFVNTWVSVGYNIRGFNDRDFESSHYTAKGAYLIFRMKFDQHSLGLDRSGASPQ